ncbi:MAG: ATP-binding protein [Marivita sp.]|uniref:ATP-binding protein n=1 Tax=Marivita sp. TaxID=2003365 RepID=UPI003EF27D6C
MSDTFTDLSDFLARIDLLQLRDRLVAEDIDLTVLPLLDDADLRELGLSLGQRKKLLKGLKASDSTTAARPPEADQDKQTPVQLRRLSVLFCDMVGSTELGEQLRIDEMQVVFQHYRDIATIVAERHHGHMAASQGDGLVILFGYPRVLDGFAERCLLAAQDLQNTLSQRPVVLDGHAPIHIATRVGIASGQAAVGHARSDVSGDHMHLVGPVVNRAARLQTVAHPSACAVDRKTRDLTKAAVLYAEPEAHVLKGLADPVEVFHVQGLRRSADTPCSPITLVGRAFEIAFLSDLWGKAQVGQTRTATISGNAGIGKSALVQSFLATHAAPPVRVLHMRCLAMAAQSPLHPVAHAMTALIGAQDTPNAITQLLNPPTPEMAQRAAQLLDMVDTPMRDTAISADDRTAILELLTSWMIGSHEHPTIVVLENAQWADDTTRDLMLRTAAHARDTGAPLLMLAVTRDTSHGFWDVQTGDSTLALPPLDRAAAKTLLHRSLRGNPVPHSVKDNVLYHADGNPLMLETLGHAQAQQHLPEVTDTVEVPHTIYESVSQRLDSIRSGRGVIEALAVLGTAASSDLLRAVAHTDTRDLDQALEALHRDGLIDQDTDPDGIRIRHKVYRDVIYEQIDGQSRRQLHLAVYHALRDSLTVQPEILASHAQAAQDWPNASAHALEAGDAFLKRSALVEAGHFFDMADGALARLPDSAAINRNRLRAITGMASVERSRFGISTDKSAALGQRAVQLSREIGDVKSELLALNGLYSHALVRADYPKAQDYAQALLTAAGESQNKTFVMIATRAIGAVALHRGDQVTAKRNLRLALDQYDTDAHFPLAHAHGYDHAEICAALLSMSLWISGDLAASRHFSTFSIEHSRSIGHAHSLAQAISFRVMLGAIARHGSEMTEIGNEGIEVAEAHGIRVMRAASQFYPFATHLCLRSNPPTEAELVELGGRTDEWLAVNPYNYGPAMASILADVYLRAGDLSAADRIMDQGTKTETATGETWTSSEMLRMRARIAEARGDADAAYRLRADALETAHRTQAATIALRITCDIAEADPNPATIRVVAEAMSKMISHDDGWDVRRAEALL